MTFMSPYEFPVVACVARVVDGGVAELLDVFELTGELMEFPPRYPGAFEASTCTIGSDSM